MSHEFLVTLGAVACVGIVAALKGSGALEAGALLVAVAPLPIAIRAGRKEMFSPVAIYGGLHVIFFGFGVAAVLWSGTTFIRKEDVFIGSLLATVGFGAFAAAFGPGPKLLSDSEARRLSWRCVAFLYGCGVIVRVLIVRMNLYYNDVTGYAVQVQNSGTVLYLVDLPVLALCMVTWAVFQDRRPSIQGLLILGVVLVIDLMYTLGSGSKGAVAGTFIVVAASAYYARGGGPVKWRGVPVFLAVSMGFMAFFVFPFIGAYRSSFGDYFSPSTLTVSFEDIREAAESSLEKAFLAKSDDMKSSDLLLGRLNRLETLALVIGATPNAVPFYGAEGILQGFYDLVPRFIWPGRPINRLGTEFTARYGLSSDPERAVENFPAITYFYIVGGSVAVIIGMGFYGFLFRGFSWLARARMREPFAMILFFYLMRAAIGMSEHGFPNTVNRLVKTLPLQMIVTGMVYYGTRRSKQNASTGCAVSTTCKIGRGAPA